jgi:hypothetical protein
VSVAEFLKLAPFSLGTVTILLAAGGLIFGHAFSRYGDDAAISFYSDGVSLSRHYWCLQRPHSCSFPLREERCQLGSPRDAPRR